MNIQKYKVWWPEQGQTQDDAREFESFDHEGAASEWAHWYDGYSTDYTIVGGAEAIVQVMRVDETAPRSVLVTGQAERSYTGHLFT